MKLWIFGVHLRSKLYTLYLQSPEWKAISDECKRLANFKCNRCDNTTNLHAHHLTYDNIGEEKQEDLECLCLSCHEEEHQRKFTQRVRGGFMLIYGSYDSALINIISSSVDYQIVTYIRDKFTYSKTEIHLSSQHIAGLFKVSKPKVTRLIKSMVDNDLLMRVDTGIYRLNPFMFIPFRANGSELQEEWKHLIDIKKGQKQ